MEGASSQIPGAGRIRRGPEMTRPPSEAASKSRCVAGPFLFELAGNAAECGVEVGAESADRGDDGNGYAGCDQAVFDCRSSRLILPKPNKTSIQTSLLIASPVP